MSLYSFCIRTLTSANIVRSLNLVTASCFQQLSVFTTTKLSQSLWPTHLSTHYIIVQQAPVKTTLTEIFADCCVKQSVKSNPIMKPFILPSITDKMHFSHVLTAGGFCAVQRLNWPTFTRCKEWLTERTEPVLFHFGSSLLWKCHERLDRVNTDNNGTKKQESSQPKGILRTRQFSRCNHNQSLSNFSRDRSSVRGLPTLCSVGTMDLSGRVQVIKLDAH